MEIFRFGLSQVYLRDLLVFFMFRHDPVKRRTAALVLQVSEIRFMSSVLLIGGSLPGVGDIPLSGPVIAGAGVQGGFQIAPPWSAGIDTAAEINIRPFRCIRSTCGVVIVHQGSSVQGSAGWSFWKSLCRSTPLLPPARKEDCLQRFEIFSVTSGWAFEESVRWSRP